uniref:DNA ligase n=1 Tax=Clastoptera arizonana TaxID=38151 RepID=A0A1B6C8P5_9HEMI
MADETISVAEDQKPFALDRSKTGRACCKKCKQKIDVGTIRIAKIVPSPFGSGLMKSWYHMNCILEVFAKQRKTTRKIESVDDLEGWNSLSKEDQKEVLSHLDLPDDGRISKLNTTPVPTLKPEPSTSTSKITSSSYDEMHKDNSFREFRRLCADVANASSYLKKTSIVKEFFTNGSNKDGFKGDLLLWCRLLLPGAVKRIYNLQSKQLVKLFSRIFNENQEKMLEDLEQGDVAETVGVFFEKNKKLLPAKKSLLTLQQVDNFLEELSTMTKEEEQMQHFTEIANKCTVNDLKIVIRLIKHDLRINAGPKHILEAVHPDAYQAFQASRDISSIITRVTPTVGAVKQTNLTIGIQLLTPVLPMLAQACKSVNDAVKKCPNGFYSEIKYDGERVQVHKKGSEFKYYSRSLKPVLPHKVNHFKNFIPQAFPYGKDLILDSEILLVDKETGKPLPFGSLGKHKKDEFHNATVCLFVFDCIFYNGESLLQKPLKVRRKILEENMVEIENHIMFSEKQEVHDPKDLELMMTKVFKLGLEGLVIKDLLSTYEPGKRHWLKVKKDYLMGGAMADSADLVVLGAWYGTGQKGGMMSVFLMGCYNEKAQNWCTVTKVHGGHDDNTLARLQDELDMVKISKNVSRVPDWLNCTKTMVPDFVARDPKAQPVWEITGAEFTKHDVHTAAGISIRFPRVTRIRNDKDWKSATTLSELKVLYEKSKDTSDFTLSSAGHNSNTSTPQKETTSPSPKKNRQVDPTEDNLSRVKRKLEVKKETIDVLDVTGTITFKRDIVQVPKDENDQPPEKKLRVSKGVILTKLCANFSAT